MNNESLRSRIYRVLNPEEQSTLLDRSGNLLIIALVLTNLFAMALETDGKLAANYGALFFCIELFSVVFFTLEYTLRVWSITIGENYQARIKFIVSVPSLIDLLAIVPFYIGFLLDIDLRIFVAFRLFRLFKLFRYFSPLVIMANVMRAEARAFVAAMLVMFVLVFMCATGIYLFESAVQPDKLGSIPQSMWWSIVTLTTLGYGDVIPMTVGGRIFAGMMTVLAVGVVALPAGMLASRFSEELHKRKSEYSDLIQALAEDGVIDGDDEVKLEQLRNDLCLSNSDVERLRQNIIELNSGIVHDVPASGQRHCSNCGHPLDP